MDQQTVDFDYFLQNMENLYQVHGHKYVAVKNQGVLGVYDTFQNAYETTVKTEEVGSFLIQECFDSRDKMVHHFQRNIVPVSA